MFEVAGAELLLPVFDEAGAPLVLPVFVFETVAAGLGLALVLPVLAGRFVELFAVPASPQAIPKALRAKSDESAITFFITNSSLLSSSKSICNLLSQPENPVCSYLKVFSEQTTL